LLAGVSRAVRRYRSNDDTEREEKGRIARTGHIE
jgi:hypothetical protein